jgi:uncharacterized protein (TIGR02598 family)
MQYRKSPAFSLIEVVLALGVVSFALLGILILLPEGLFSVHNAETLQATSNIANQLRGQMQLLSFVSTDPDAIQNLPETNYYYTTDGVQTNLADAYYKASFAVTNIAPTLSPVDDAAFNSNSAQNVLVTLTYPPPVWNRTNSFPILVARQTDN